MKKPIWTNIEEFMLGISVIESPPYIKCRVQDAEKKKRGKKKVAEDVGDINRR